MRHLVYRVQPLPQSLLPLVWDFGSLQSKDSHNNTEQAYIKQIVTKFIVGYFDSSTLLLMSFSLIKGPLCMWFWVLCGPNQVRRASICWKTLIHGNASIIFSPWLDFLNIFCWYCEMNHSWNADTISFAWTGNSDKWFEIWWIGEPCCRATVCFTELYEKTGGRCIFISDKVMKWIATV